MELVLDDGWFGERNMTMQVWEITMSTPKALMVLRNLLIK